eukprot:6213118-Pleurochrysis_carterae.AAC.1
MSRNVSVETFSRHAQQCGDDAAGFFPCLALWPLASQHSPDVQQRQHTSCVDVQNQLCCLTKSVLSRRSALFALLARAKRIPRTTQIRVTER